MSRHSPRRRAGALAWIDELVWRDFYAAVLEEHPHVLDRAFRPAFEHVRWNDDEAGFAAWCAGRTGYPLVDAGMRELAATGWMHNRARMVAASFLVKDLRIDWRRGERWFSKRLVDGDPASNNGGWQWSASTGTDAQPDFRIFSPTAQGERFDATGAYVRRWVPELRDVPDVLVHRPWEAPALAPDYPPPIVDHAQRRILALKRFEEAHAGARPPTGAEVAAGEVARPSVVSPTARPAPGGRAALGGSRLVDVVLLDLGGVLVELGGVAAMQRLLGAHLTPDEIHALWGESESVLAYETGKIAASAFAQRIVGELQLPVSPEAFLEEFARWPTRLRPGALELVRSIPASYRVSALSNTNEIHWATVGGVLGLAGEFHRHYFSHKVGFMKPDARIFEAALSDLRTPAHRALFLDDSPRNVAAARAVGMQAQLARDAAEAREVLARLGIV